MFLRVQKRVFSPSILKGTLDGVATLADMVGKEPLTALMRLLRPEKLMVALPVMLIGAMPLDELEAVLNVPREMFDPRLMLMVLEPLRLPVATSASNCGYEVFGPLAHHHFDRVSLLIRGTRTQTKTSNTCRIYCKVCCHSSSDKRSECHKSLNAPLSIYVCIKVKRSLS